MWSKHKLIHYDWKWNMTGCEGKGGWDDGGGGEGEKARVMSLGKSLWVRAKRMCKRLMIRWSFKTKANNFFSFLFWKHIQTHRHTHPYITPSSKRKQKKYKWNEERKHRENLTERNLYYIIKIGPKCMCLVEQRGGKRKPNVCGMFHVKKNLHPPTFNYLYKWVYETKAENQRCWWWWWKREKEEEEMPRFLFMLIWKEKFDSHPPQFAAHHHHPDH